MPHTRRARVAKRGWKDLRTITVRELIESLEDQDPDALVVFSSDYGDYCHTKQVHAIDGDVYETELEESAYSHSGWAVVEDDREDRDEEDDEPKAAQPDEPIVLVIR